MSWKCYRCGTNPCECRDGICLIHGDCEAVIPHLGDQSIDLVLTDPPYELFTGMGNKGCFKDSYRKVVSDELQAISDGFDIEKRFDDFSRILRVISGFVFCSNKQIARIMTTAYRRGWNPTVLVWHKYNSVPFSHGTWRQDAEFCVHFKANGAPMNGNATIKSKVKTMPMCSDEYDHPTIKPLPLICDYMAVGSNEGATVLDCYAGSGTTLVAAKQLGRKAIGIEIEEKYVQICCERLRQEVLPLKD